MARKKSHNKEAILQTAVDLIDKYGKASFSVRNVAKHLNASTQPIYSYFSDTQDLYEQVLQEIERLLLQQINHPYSAFVFRNMGYGFTLFAKEHPNLFEAFFNEKERNQRFIHLFLKKLRDALDQDERFHHMSSQGKDLLLEKMWTFCFGYASLIIRGLVPDSSDEQIKQMVLDMGTAVIKDAMAKEGLI